MYDVRESETVLLLAVCACTFVAPRDISNGQSPSAQRHLIRLFCEDYCPAHPSFTPVVLWMRTRPSMMFRSAFHLNVLLFCLSQVFDVVTY